MGVPEGWHEEMRGRAYAFLVTVDERLPRDTAALAHDLIDGNEYGVAVEVMADVLHEVGQVLTEAEAAQLGSLLADMGLDPPRT